MATIKVTRMRYRYAIQFLIYRTDVIYQGRKGDKVVEYIKRKGQEKNFVMYGVLYDATLQLQPNDDLSKNEREFCLSPNTYPWRADLIQRLTKQLQTSGKQVGLLDDMGRASVAYHIITEFYTLA